MKVTDFDQLESSYKDALDSDGSLLDVIENQWCDVDEIIPAIRDLLKAFSDGDDLNEAGTGLAEVIDKGVEKYAKHHMPEPISKGME